MNEYAPRAVFVGARIAGHPRDPNAPYPLYLKPEGENGRYMYFWAQALPLVDWNSPAHTCFRLTFRKSDGRQVIETRRGQTIEGGWQLEGRAA